MDWIKFPFTARYKLHDSPDAPWVDVLWTPTDLPFLEIETLVNCRIWDSDDVTDLPIGQSWPIERGYSNVWGIDGLTGEHRCGEDSDFEDGQPWPYDGPPIEYDADHIPLCCPRDRGQDVTAGASVDTGLDRGYAIAPTAGASVDYLTAPVPLTVQAGAVADASGLVEHITAGASVDSLAGHPPVHSVTAGASVDSLPGHPPVHSVTAGSSVDTGLEPGYAIAPTAGASVDYVTGGGYWERTVPGDYVFTALASGPHIIEGTGAAGGGEDPNDGHGGTGGGGGGWARRTVTLTAGDTLNVHVGAGGPNGFGAVPPGEPSTVADLTPFILCKGAGGESGAGGGAGGAGGLCIGDLVHGGGDGAPNAGDAGGGGGSSGGPTAAGNHGNVPDGGAAVPGGGKGGWSTPHAPDQYPDAPGGAGGGGDNSLLTAGDGGREGKVIIRW